MPPPRWLSTSPCRCLPLAAHDACGPVAPSRARRSSATRARRCTSTAPSRSPSPSAMLSTPISTCVRALTAAPHRTAGRPRTRCDFFALPRAAVDRTLPARFFPLPSSAPSLPSRPSCRVCWPQGRLAGRPHRRRRRRRAAERAAMSDDAQRRQLRSGAAAVHSGRNGSRAARAVAVTLRARGAALRRAGCRGPDECHNRSATRGLLNLLRSRGGATPEVYLVAVLTS